MKKIGILFIIIIVLTGILAFKVLAPKKEKENKLEIVQLLEKSLEYDNYVLKYKIGNEHRTKMVKGSIIVSKVEETDYYTWTDLDKKENIIMNLKRKEALIRNATEDQIKNVRERIPLPKEDIIREIVNNPQKYDLKNIKQEEYNGKKCITFITKMDEKGEEFVITKEEEVSKPDIYLEKIWIDANKGTIVKSKSKSNQGTLLDIDYDVELNTVTDNDVARPNLEGYKIQNIEQQ